MIKFSMLRTDYFITNYFNPNDNMVLKINVQRSENVSWNDCAKELWKCYQMQIRVTESAVLDVDVHVEVAGADSTDNKFLIVALLGLLADGGCFVRWHFGWSSTIQSRCQTDLVEKCWLEKRMKCSEWTCVTIMIVPFPCNNFFSLSNRSVVCVHTRVQPTE